MYRDILPEELKVQKSSGYIYFIDKDHPIANSSDRVLLHRHVASIQAGRWVLPTEDVHHKNRIRSDNSPDNLQILTKAEHTALHNLEDRGIDPIKSVNCKYCNEEFLPKEKNNVFCSNTCKAKSQIKLDSLTKEELEELIWANPFTVLAKQFNCSDNGIRKWALRLGCLMPPARFHVKYKNAEIKLKVYNDIKDL
jgi:hypothetical protein